VTCLNFPEARIPNHAVAYEYSDFLGLLACQIVTNHQHKWGEVGDVKTNWKWRSKA
jgi:hypothetical protein